MWPPQLAREAVETWQRFGLGKVVVEEQLSVAQLHSGQDAVWAWQQPQPGAAPFSKATAFYQ